MKFLNMFLIAVLAIGFVSCGGDDEDPVMGDKSDLIGTYKGNLSISITSVGGKTPYEKTDASFQLRSWIQDNTKLAAYFSDLPDGILASNFRITDTAYTFTLDGTPTGGFTMQGNEIPAYITSWYETDYPGGFSRAVLTLNSSEAKFDRKTAKLAFTYSGSITLTPQNTAYSPITPNIQFIYTDLAKN